MMRDATETVIKARVRLAIGKLPHIRLFNSPTGEAWAGHVKQRVGNTVLLTNAYRIVYGLAPGSSDLIGITSVMVTPDHVGTRLGLFSAAEVKRPGVVVPEHQQNFINFIRSFGGIAGVVRSPEDALQLIGAGQV